MAGGRLAGPMLAVVVLTGIFFFQNALVRRPRLYTWVRRGFLDVTVQVTPSYRLRCVGAHLKSKLPIPEGVEPTAPEVTRIVSASSQR